MDNDQHQADQDALRLVTGRVPSRSRSHRADQARGHHDQPAWQPRSGLPGAAPRPGDPRWCHHLPNMLPGVSLTLTAAPWRVSITFSVASAHAAASQALRDLHLTVTTRGLTAGTDRTGNLKAMARGLGSVFSGPAATSWDSPASPATRSPASQRRRTAPHAKWHDAAPAP